ncbi:MAG: hypothetical protein KC933_21055 [Myxococcales bacterium]|nr:hypothetical protein [Myxococcales bacterium]
MTPIALCLLLAAAPSPVEEAAAALADFRPEDAVQLLEAAKEDGPFPHEEHALLYEELGIAYAYLERSDDAVRAFVTMLALDPTRAISYTLSPKVTFLFEEARKQARGRPEPALDVSWPRDLKVEDPVPVDVGVLADPEGFLQRGRLYFREKGQADFQSLTLQLPPPGRDLRQVKVPPLAAGATEPKVVELYLVATDARDNEVLLFGSAARPREVSLAYEPPDPWYGKWWVWVIAGSVVAATAGTVAYAVTREPSPTVDGSFRWDR